MLGGEWDFFTESFNQKSFNEVMGCHISFVQDNHSRSAKGVLRELHHHIQQPHCRLVRCIGSTVSGVVVDIRRYSPTFGRWVGVEPSGEGYLHVWIPPGFAHGFLELSGSADFFCKTTDYYASAHERWICWNNSELDIRWPVIDREDMLFGKDSARASFDVADYFSLYRAQAL